MINWTLIAAVVFLAILLVAYTIWRNKKDRKDLEEDLNSPEVFVEDIEDVTDEENSH